MEPIGCGVSIALVFSLLECDLEDHLAKEMTMHCTLMLEVTRPFQLSLFFLQVLFSNPLRTTSYLFGGPSEKSLKRSWRSSGPY